MPTKQIEMSNEELNDFDLARGISNGDEKALESFYGIYADLLFAYIKRLLYKAPRAVIEDIWQESLISAIKGMADFRGNSRLFTWICGIAKLKVADYCRRKKTSLKPNRNTHKNNLEYLIDKSILPEDYVLQQAVRRRVIKVLGVIPAQYQRILIQRYIEGLHVKEIATSIRKTYKATESLLSRARQAFKSSYIKLSQEERDE